MESKDTAHTSEEKLERVSTGIPGLDQSIGGGIPLGFITMVSGEPGTGKTTFALQYAFHQAKKGEKVLYITTSESISKLRRLAKRFDFYDPKLLREKKIIFHDYSISEYVDELSKVDAASFFKNLGKTIKREGIKHLIIDPVTILGLVYEREIDFRRNILLIEPIIGQIGCTTLLTAEIPKGTDLYSKYGIKEYIVDEVLILRKELLDGRIVRHIQLEKMRGTEIKQPSYPYTLKDGFRCFEPFKYSPPEHRREWEPVPDTEKHFSTGSEDLDKVLGGGYRRGGFVLIDVGENVPPAGYRLFNYLPLLNFITQDRGAAIITVGGADAEEVRKRASMFVSSERFDKYVRIIERKMPDKDQNKPYIVTIDGESLEEDKKKWLEVQSELREMTKAPLYLHFGYDVLEYRYWEQALVEFTSQIVSLVKGHGDLGIAVTKPGLASTQELANMATMHIKIIEIDGSIAFYGIQPRTGVYHINIDVSRGFPKLKLTPIV
ncbi:MAG: ATPase domain-containing protein [Candidatus Hydrothermarchaeota archaeon]